MRPRKEARSIWAPVPLASGAEAMAGRRAKVTRTPVRFQGTPLSQKPRECDGSAQCLLVYDRPVPCLLRRGLRPPAAGVTLALLLGLGALPATAVSKPPTTLDALLLPGRKLPLPGAQGEQARVPKLVQRMRGGGDLVKCKIEVSVGSRGTILYPGDAMVLVWADHVSHGPRPYQKWDAEKNVIELSRLSPLSLSTPVQKVSSELSWWGTEVALPVGDTVRYRFGIRRRDGSLAVEQGFPRESVIPDGHGAVLCSVFGDEKWCVGAEINAIAAVSCLGERLDAWAHHVRAQIAGLRPQNNTGEFVYKCQAQLRRATASMLEVVSQHSFVLIAHLPVAAFLLWDCLIVGPHRNPTRTQGVLAAMQLRESGHRSRRDDENDCKWKPRRFRV